MKQLKVYVVVHGECNEGGNVMGVFKTKKKAIKAGLDIRPIFEGGWVKQNGEEYTHSYLNGCDFIDIIEEIVI